MPKLFLTGHRVLEISENQAIEISKCIMLLPEWKQIKVNGVEFRLDEIDIEAEKASKLPQQTVMDIRVPVVVVEKPKRMSKKSIDNRA